MLWALFALAGADEPNVAVQPQTELVSIVFRLARVVPYHTARPSPYLDDVDAWFAPYANEPAVRRAQALARGRHIAFDAPASFAAQLDPQGRLAPLEVRQLDPRWTQEEAEAFRRELRQFARASRFKAFWRTQADTAAALEGAAQGHLSEWPLWSWLDDQFNTSPPPLTVHLSLANGPAHYAVAGPQVEGSDATTTILAVDWDRAEALSPRAYEQLTHQAFVAYARPLVRPAEQGWEPSAISAYAQVRDEMEALQLNSASTFSQETAARALHVLYSLDHEGPEAACRVATHHVQQGFRYVRPLALALDAARDQGSLDDALATVSEVFDRPGADVPRTNIRQAFLERPNATLLLGSNEQLLAHYMPHVTPFLSATFGRTFHSALVEDAQWPHYTQAIYGTPSGVPGLGKLLADNGWQVTSEGITYDGTFYEGEHLLLIAALTRPDGGRVVVYTGATPGVIHDAHTLPHGETPWLIADRSTPTPRLVAGESSGRFPHCEGIQPLH